MVKEGTNVESLDKILLIKNSAFLKLFPGIEGVVGFIASAADGYESQNQTYPVFKELNVENIEGYLNLLQKNNPRAKEIYENVRRIFRF